MPLISGGRYFGGGDCYFRDLIGGQKFNVTKARTTDRIITSSSGKSSLKWGAAVVS